jgi:hypothetical protein
MKNQETKISEVDKSIIRIKKGEDRRRESKD